MKKNIFVRIFAGMGGAVLWLLALGMLAETFFDLPVTEKAGQLLNAGSPLAVLAVLLCAIVLCVFGTCCVLMLSSKRAAKRAGFVMQKGENGVIGVSVKSIEGLVLTCIKQHDMVERAEISVVQRRDGIVILLNILETAGVNIPLAVGALQKQIRQYVNECTGVDVHEVRVMVENTDNDGAESPYAVAKPVVLTTAATAAAMRHEEPAPEVQTEQVTETVSVEEEVPAAEEMPVQEEPALLPAEEELPAAAEEAPVPEIPVVMAAPVLPEIPPMPELIEEEDDRPLHQRLFGTEEQPVFVPVPPEMMAPPVVEELPGEEQEEVVAEAAEEILEEAESSDEIAADAVLEVVQAIAQEEELAAEEEQPEAADFEYDEETLKEQSALEGDDEEIETAALECGI